MPDKLLTTGNGAAALAVTQAKVDFIAAYPITPQTSVAEKLSEYIAKGQLDAGYLAVESEHSALASVASASMAGARVFTATSSQGLLYMHEIIHYVAGGRLPVVMVNVNRAVCPPWSLYVDHHDALSQRDTGWMQFFCGDTQEIYDTILQAYYIAEKIHLPVMVNYDGFLLSHSMMAIDTNTQEQTDSFLPPIKVEWSLAPEHGVATFGNVTPTEEYTPYRKDLQDAMDNADVVIKEAADKYRDITGRSHGYSISCYGCEDAEYFLIAMGSMAKEMEVAADILREEGIKAGVIRIRVFRPFPGKEILDVMPEAAKAIVFDRDYGFGSHGGIVCQELKSTLYDSGKSIKVKGLTCGLGGEDLPAKYLAQLAKEQMEGQVK
ncbi:MAG: transketolase C-terminal domain-containing protein [Bacillota bacterium]|nr:transketolase C-terminal domain-containing protein [Bacillota bacterium]